MAVAATFGLALGAVLLRLRDFAGYVSTTPSGEPILYSGLLGPLRRLADAAPFRLPLRPLRGIVVAAVAGLALFLMLKVRARHLDRWKASRFRLRDRWELHEVPVASGPSAAVLTGEEALWGALAWPVGYLLAGWLLAALEGVLALAARLQMAPDLVQWWRPRHGRPLGGDGPLRLRPVAAPVYKGGGGQDARRQDTTLESEEGAWRSRRAGPGL